MIWEENAAEEVLLAGKGVEAEQQRGNRQKENRGDLPHESGAAQRLGGRGVQLGLHRALQMREGEREGREARTMITKNCEEYKA